MGPCVVGEIRFLLLSIEECQNVIGDRCGRKKEGNSQRIGKVHEGC